MKKLRQWSHDSLANLSHLTNRNNNVDPKHKSRFSCDESHFPTNGISTISSAIREQRIDPKRDNFGLYALKCDRSTANARRGILLNIPTTLVKTKVEVASFQSVEQNHEVFQPCEKIADLSSGIMYDGATSSGSGTDNKMKIEPPPRKKKRPAATRAIVPKQAPKKPILKQASLNMVKTESLDKNDSGLYRIASETAKLSTEEPRKKEHVVTIVKPKVQNAVAVKAKPVQQQVAKVKSYEWNKHQRKSSIGNVIAKPHSTKRYIAESSSSSFKSENSVNIFQSNKLLDQRKMFDEFDALFDKSKESSGTLPEATPESAFNKLSALKFPSTTFSGESGNEARAGKELVLTKPMLNNNTKARDFYKKNIPQVPTSKEVVSSKPIIVSEQPKTTQGIIKKKILYYDDEHEFKQLIMNQTQSTTIINNHYGATVIPPRIPPSDDGGIIERRVPISCSNSVDTATGQFDLNGNDASEDYRRSNNPKASEAVNSNSLRIFSNEVFVFNL